MQLKQLQLKNFRCFSHFTLDFEHPVTLIAGNNGVGKTTILEALHYLCYMRSFRSHSPSDLIKFKEDNFFIRLLFGVKDDCLEGLEYDLQIGFSKNKRMVKLNKKNISSFKELMDFYRVVTLTEDDLQIINGGPSVRRNFIDQAILLSEPIFLSVFRDFKDVLEQRNALLHQGKFSQDSYDLWSEQLFQKSKVIQEKRQYLLEVFEKKINDILQDTFDDNISVNFEYIAKNMDRKRTYEDFQTNLLLKFSEQEKRFSRSLFGSHLDDFSIHFQQKKSKLYASRGQQKLILLLLKAAQLLDLSIQKGASVFLLDDFLSDFDEERAGHLIDFLVSLKSSLIFTSPAQSGFLGKRLSDLGVSLREVSA